MKIWAIVPVKPFNRAKSRLAKVLAAGEREALAEKMLRHVLHVLSGVKQIAGVLVISRDTKILSIAREYAAHTVQESGTPELNAALLRASQVVGAQGADGVLMLPADLPLIQAEDVENLLHIGRYNMTVVLCPDRNEEGTNALLVNPPGLIPFSFGPGSFRRHLELAQAAGATIRIHHSERIGLDLDTPLDLSIYHQMTGTIMPRERAQDNLPVTD